jgi:hypothetical protein
MKIAFDQLNQMVTVTVNGSVRISGIIELIDRAVSLGEKHNCYHIIFNLQKAKENASFNELYELHKKLMQLTTLTYKHQIALVFSPDENKFKRQFYETVGANWGQKIFKVFFDYKEGFEWLASIKK